MLFVFEMKYVIVLSYPKTKYFCKHRVKFSLIDPRGLHNQLIVPLATIFVLTLDI
jgi:hypothetical protein